MTLDDVKALMKECHVGQFATTDGARPTVRPMGAWAWVDGELWLASGKHSTKVADLGKIAAAEVCFMTPDGRHARIAGPCTVSEDPADKDRLFHLIDMLEKYVHGPTDPEYVVLRLKPVSIRAMVADVMTYTEIPAE